MAGEYDDVDLDELAAQAARDRANDKGQQLGDLPVSNAPLPSPGLRHPREEAEAGVGTSAGTEPAAASVNGRARLQLPFRRICGASSKTRCDQGTLIRQ